LTHKGKNVDKIYAAVKSLYEERGAGYCFPPDKLWEYVDTESIGMTPHAAISALKKGNYIVKTGGTARSVSEARKGAPVTEYTFGATIDPNSLAIAIANRSGGTHAAIVPSKSDLSTIQENSSGVLDLGFPLQRILYGCPGSGKSYLLSENANKANFVVRTVFFQETSYYDFVGGLKPQSIYRVTDEPISYIGSTVDVPGEPVIQYVVQPGPFLKAYRLACEHPGKSVVLIIEELSRAVAAHVFGDVLQLLDRIDEGPLTGFSEYEVDARPDIESWILLNDVSHDNVGAGRLRLPANLYIWATMNRADQNARQLDSAFLRRWSKTYMSYLEKGTSDTTLIRYGGNNVEWGDLRQAINRRLLEIGGIPEDKFVGAYMISTRKLKDPNEMFEELWGYLWNDVLKTRASQMFHGCATLAELRLKWDGGQGAVFGDLFV
jgi:5-methylcytosine-specific restriction protein B